MAVTKNELRLWFDIGVKQGDSHMAVFMDTFDYDDYPVYINAINSEHAISAINKHDDRLMEVYNLTMDRESQMAEHRAFNY